MEDRKTHVRSVKPKFRTAIVPGERWKEVEFKYGEKLTDIVNQEKALKKGTAIKEPAYCDIFQNEW